MSLIGDRAAFISVGISCQTVHQIESAIDLTRELTGDSTIERKASLFDWLICPPSSAASMLEAQEFFPASPGELKKIPLIEIKRGRPPYIFGWPRQNVFFWHEFLELTETLEQQFTKTQEKFRRLTSRLLSLRSREVFAFVSNTQSNLDMVERVTGVNPTVSSSEVNRLKSALERTLERPVYVCLVTKQSAFVVDEKPRFLSYFIHQTVGHWSGEENLWRPVIRKFLRESDG